MPVMKNEKRWGKEYRFQIGLVRTQMLLRIRLACLAPLALSHATRWMIMSRLVAINGIYLSDSTER